MIIRRLNIKNFGKIHDRDLELSPGMNVLYGENESGKTTVHTFIRSMFYGVRRLRGKAAQNDPYTKYEPWENPATYGGILWFETGGRKYRLTRNFYRESKFSELLCEDTGSLQNPDQGALDELLGDVSEAVYDNTVSVAQLKSVTGKELIRELQNYMASYQGTGDNSLDLGRAEQMLKMSRKGFLTEISRRKKDLEKEKEKITANIEYLNKELSELDEQRLKISDQEEGLRIRPGEGNGRAVLEERVQKVRRKREMTDILLALITVAGMAGSWSLAVCAGMVEMSIVSGAVAVIAALAGFFLHISASRDLNKRERQLARWISRQEELKWNRSSLDGSYEEKQTALGNLKAELQECENENYTLTPEETEIQALNMALETIEALSGNINSQVGRNLRQRTSEILSEITGGKYTQVLMDENLNMTVNTGDRIVSLERLSRGTLEQIYFALRMAAGELFCGKDTFPVILDDVFGMYDEDRLTAVLKWLCKEERQVIISTCHKREMELLDKAEIPYRKLFL